MTRLLIIEVPDTATQDNIEMALAVWNDDEDRLEDNRMIRIIQQTSIIVGEK